MPPFDPALAAHYPIVIGCDEVGRGALSGPVVVAAVWFAPTAIPPDLLSSLDDSKKLPEPVRNRLNRLNEKILVVRKGEDFAADFAYAIVRLGVGQIGHR